MPRGGPLRASPLRHRHKPSEKTMIRDGIELAKFCPPAERGAIGLIFAGGLLTFMVRVGSERDGGRGGSPVEG